MSIKHILFDADGVLQYATLHWQPALQSALQLEDDAQAAAVLAAVFEAEAAVLEVPTGFAELLEKALERWGCSDSMPAALAALHSIDVYSDVMRVVQSLRRVGYRCYIGSNQQALRAQHMSKNLSYKNLFDREFYSCFIGAAKPKALFFERVLADLGVQAQEVLFLDDRVENVEAAKLVGLNAIEFRGASGATFLERQLANFGIFASLRE